MNAPEDINGWFGFVTVPPAPPFPEQFHLQKMCTIVWCYSGALEQAEERFKPIRADIPPAVDFAGPIPWPVLQSLFDALYPKGLQWYWKTDFFTELSDKAIDLHLKYGPRLPTMHSTMHLYPINGAVHRIGSQDTAFSFREANFAEVIVGVDPDNEVHSIGKRSLRTRLLNRYMRHVVELTAFDPGMAATLLRVRNLLKPLRALFQPYIILAVLRLELTDVRRKSAVTETAGAVSEPVSGRNESAHSKVEAQRARAS